MARGEGRFVVCPSASAAPGDLPGHRRLGALRLALMASFVPPLLRGEGGGGEGAGGGVMGPLMDANLIGYSCVASLTKWTLRAPIFLFLPRWEGSHLTVLPPKLIQLGILLSFFYPFL